jgi:hypothetical protein
MNRGTVLTVLMRWLAIFGIASLVFLAGCGGSTAPAVNNPPPSVTPPPTRVTVSLSPTSLAFGNQTIKTTSAPKTVTLTNTGTAPAPFDFLQISGPHSADFAQTNNCPLTIAAGTSCTFSLTPTAIGFVPHGRAL